MVKVFFSERTALDECVSIEIAEKYKTTALGGHRQGNQKEKKRKKTTILTGWLDWDINTAKL